jgi:hypothetical protein
MTPFAFTSVVVVLLASWTTWLLYATWRTGRHLYVAGRYDAAARKLVIATKKLKTCVVEERKRLSDWSAALERTASASEALAASNDVVSKNLEDRERIYDELKVLWEQRVANLQESVAILASACTSVDEWFRTYVGSLPLGSSARDGAREAASRVEEALRSVGVESRGEPTS